MKPFFAFLICMCLSSPSNAQNKYAGVWRDYEASDMTINPDHTFQFIFRFDTILSWANGTWTEQKDTLYFTWIPLYDTLSVFDSLTKRMKDTLFLSVSPKPKRLSQIPDGVQTTAGQTEYFFPKKLYYHRDVFYDFNVETGEMLTKRYKPLWGSKKKPAGFHRNTRPERNYISVE